MNKCESCGMPMAKISDFGGGKQGNKYCRYCSYENGTLKPRHEVRENMVQFYIKAKNMDRTEAEAFVDEIMARNPVWK